MSLEKVVFKGKKFSDILEEIYDNQKKKDRQITGLIGELRPLIQDTGDATVVVPLIKEYLEISVKNDEQLIKVAQIVQRVFQTRENTSDSFNITEEEKEQLLREIDALVEKR
jgi:hypothetical protein